MRVQALLLQLARHLGYYLQLGAVAAVEYRGTCVRRLVMMLLGLVTGIVGLAALWCAGLLALWDTPWRMAYVLVSSAVLIAVSAWSMYRALAPAPGGAAAGMLKSEMDKDMELFHQWKSTISQ
jgi:uncharacterized membrane protein (UPF0136 family)